MGFVLSTSEYQYIIISVHQYISTSVHHYISISKKFQLLIGINQCRAAHGYFGHNYSGLFENIICQYGCQYIVRFMGKKINFFQTGVKPLPDPLYPVIDTLKVRGVQAISYEADNYLFIGQSQVQYIPPAGNIGNDRTYGISFQQVNPFV